MSNEVKKIKLTQDAKSYKHYVFYAKAGDTCTIIKEDGDMLLLEFKGNLFYKNKNNT